MTKQDLIADLIQDLRDYLRLETFISGDLDFSAVGKCGTDHGYELHIPRQERIDQAIRNSAQRQLNELAAKLSAILTHYNELTSGKYEDEQEVA